MAVLLMTVLGPEWSSANGRSRHSTFDVRRVRWRNAVAPRLDGAFDIVGLRPELIHWIKLMKCQRPSFFCANALGGECRMPVYHQSLKRSVPRRPKGCRQSSSRSCLWCFSFLDFFCLHLSFLQSQYQSSCSTYVGRS